MLGFWIKVLMVLCKKNLERRHSTKVAFVPTARAVLGLNRRSRDLFSDAAKLMNRTLLKEWTEKSLIGDQAHIRYWKASTANMYVNYSTFDSVFCCHCFSHSWMWFLHLSEQQLR